jgi:hypothetical protein
MSRRYLKAFLPVLFLTLGGLLPSGAGAVQEDGPAGDDPRTLPSPLPVHRVLDHLVVEGRVDDSVWDQIEPLPLVMFSPTFGAPLTERTEIRIAHDAQYLYVSGRMYDSDPSGIRTNTFYRDQVSGDDLLAVILDTYNDYETGVWLTTNPAGTRGDRTISNDAVFSGGNQVMNFDWNAHWDVTTHQNEEGWFAEFRIPFSSLGFQVRDGEVTMGLRVYRFIARKNERQIFPATDPSWGGFAFARPSQAHRIVMRGVEQTNPLYLTPYVLGGGTQLPRSALGSGGEELWGTSTDGTSEVGVDLRYSPLANLSLDVTLNTDFAQVEADDQQVNLTRFPLFFPEKRQFFQERSSTFDFSTGRGPDRLFHSRRIGLEAGEMVRIYGGARAVGRVGGTDFGFLTMQTEGSPLVPDARSQNASVLRLSQQVLNPVSSVGGMVTSRLGTGGADNVAVGFDSSLRLFGDEWLELVWARSFDQGVEDSSLLETSVIRGSWERIRDEGLSYALELRRVGEEFHPGLGFQARRDYGYLGTRVQYRSFFGEASPLRSVYGRVRTQDFRRNREGGAISRLVEPEVGWEFKGGSQLQTQVTSSFEDIDVPFAVTGVEIPVGDYWFHQAQLQYQRPRSSLIRGSVTGTAGSFYDGTRVGLSMDPSWTQSRYLELGGGYEVNRLSFPDRDLASTTHLVRLRLQVALNNRVSFSSLAQYSNAAELAAVNARFRYHFREGTDLWLVYNEGWNLDRDPLERPGLPRTAGRSFMVKYSHTLIR